MEGAANARAASEENTDVLNSPKRPPIRGLMSQTPASRVHLPACLLTATLLAGAMATNSRSEYQKAWQEWIVQTISGKAELTPQRCELGALQ